MATQPHPTPAATWVAIDIAKRYHAVLIEGPDSKQQRFRMASSREDHQRLVDLLHSMPTPIRIAMEPTGDCHRTLAFRLLQEGFEVCLVSSVAGARYREALFNSRDKNDPKDASVILAMLKQGMTMRYVDPLLAGHHGLQELSKTHYQISLARTRLQHSLMTHYLPCISQKSSATSMAHMPIGSPDSCFVFPLLPRSANSLWMLSARKLGSSSAAR